MCLWEYVMELVSAWECVIESLSDCVIECVNEYECQ